MKVYGVKHNGYYPVGGASVVVAENLQMARDLIRFELIGRKIDTNNIEIFEIDLRYAHVTMLNDGNY